MNAIAKMVFGPSWADAYPAERHYLETCFQMNGKTVPSEEVRDLRELNEFLPHFPYNIEEDGANRPTAISDPELLRIGKRGMLPKYDLALRRQGYRPWEINSLAQIAEWSDAFHKADVQEEHFKSFSLDKGSNGKRRNCDSKGGDSKPKAHKKSRNGAGPKQGGTPCGNCGRTNHATEDCKAPGGAKHDASKWRTSNAGAGKFQGKSARPTLPRYDVHGHIAQDKRRLQVTTNVTNALAVVSTLPQEKVDPQPKRCKRLAEEASREELLIKKQSLQETLAIACLAQRFAMMSLV